MKEAKLKTKLLNALPFPIILVVCLLIYLDAGVFTYGYWNWGDSVFAFFPERMLAENFYLWNMFSGTGAPAIYPGALPFYFLIFALDHLGIPLWVVSKIVYILPTAMAGWFMYLLAGSFISGRHQRESRLVAALLYMLMFWSWANAKFTFSFAAVPLVLTLLIKGMNSKRNGFLLAFLFALSWLMLTIAPAFVPLGLILILSYFVFYGVSNKWHIGSEVKSFLIPAIMLSFSFSASLILPQLDNFFAHNMAPELFSSPGDAMAVLKFTQPYTSLIWVFRLMYGYLNELASYYGMPVVIIAGFIIPIYAYSALLFHNKRKEASCLAIMGILFTALATGIHYPLFSSVYLWLFDHMPYFHGFRIPYKFVYPLILIYACLIGLTTQGILKFCGERIAQHRLRNAVRLIAVVGILAMIFIQMFPFSQRTKYSSSYRSSMVVPSDYYDLHDYLAANSEPGDRLLVLPWQTWYTTYTWYTSHDQPDIAARFAPIPVLGASPDDKLQGIAKILNDEIKSKNPHNMPSIVDILSMLNLRYILIHNDVPGANTSEIQLFLDDAEYFTKVGSYSNFTLLELRRECTLENQFGDIYIYGIDEDYFLPYIYPTTIATLVVGGVNDLPSLVTLDNFRIKNGIFFPRFLKDKQKRFILSKSGEKLVSNTPAIVKFRGEKFAVDRWVVPEAEKYEILVKAKGELKNKGLKALSLKMNGVSVVSKAPVFRTDGWVSLGDFVFEKGGHRLSLYAMDKKGKETRVRGAYIVLRKSKLANNVPPKISFKKINPTKYVVKVEKAVKPFFLVFSESFHSGWKAYIREANGQRPEVGGWRPGDEIVAEYPKLEVREAKHEMKFTPGDISYLFKKPINEDKHFLVNGYANSWWVDLDDVKKSGEYVQNPDGSIDFEMALYFTPQSYFYFGLMISGLTLLGCLGYLGYDWKRKRDTGAGK